jgi:hypothetical protein
MAQGICLKILDNPRAEWMFEFPYVQVQWEEPKEATKLRREKCPEIEMDIVTSEYDKGERTWERGREGVVMELRYGAGILVLA